MISELSHHHHLSMCLLLNEQKHTQTVAHVFWKGADAPERHGCPSPSLHCVTALVLGDYPAGIALKDRAVELIMKRASQVPIALLLQYASARFCPSTW